MSTRYFFLSIMKKNFPEGFTALGGQFFYPGSPDLRHFLEQKQKNMKLYINENVW